MPLIPGARLGPYEVIAAIGAGGMGEIFRARDLRLARDVAIKVLPGRLADDGVALARFEREARAVAALSHPNILSIFDVGADLGVTYAVTELLEGGTLRQRLQEGPLAPRKALEYAAQIAQGLAAAHDKGIVHRDLKPENVFVTPDGRVKILDFGLARQADEGASADAGGPTVVVLTDPGVVAGTPAYMAPEQVRGQAVTPQVDIFAFGSMLFEMLTGQRAFKGQAAAEVMNAVLKEDPPDVLTLAPAVPAALAHLVRHCLEKQPGERFQSARDLAFNLQVLAGTATPTPAPGATSPAASGDSAGATPPPPAFRGAAGRWQRRLIMGLAAAGVVVLAAGIAAVWILQARRHPAAPHFTRVSYTQKAIFRAAFAPERGTLIYSAALEGNEPEVLVLNAEYPSSRSLGLRDTHLLAVSGKGELALLTRARIVGPEVFVGTLARMPIGSTAPRELLDGVRDADWLPDGESIVVVRTEDGRDSIEWPGAPARYQSDGYLSDLHASPAGDRVVFVDHPYGSEGRGTIVVLERGGRATAVAGPYPFVRGAAWTADGKEVLFSASPGGTDTTAIFGVAPGGPVRQLLEGAGSLTIHDVAPDGRWLVTRDDRRSGVRALAPGATAERELSWLDQSRLAALSNDGRTVLFTELAAPAGPTGTVCVRSTDGAPPVALGPGEARDLSSDGRLALAADNSAPRLLIYPTGAGTSRTVPAGALSEYRSAAFLPDARRVVVCGPDKGAPSRCAVQDLQGGERRTVTGRADGGLVSPDGADLIAWTAQGPAVIYPVAGGEPRPARSLTSDDVPVGWTADGRGVLVYQPHRVPCVIERVDLATGRRETARRIAGPEGVGVLTIDTPRVTPGLAAYAYSYTRLLSTLFTVAW